ncbi:hypothetical protein GCM10009773_37130 [Williamsia serinedens]
MPDVPICTPSGSLPTSITVPIGRVVGVGATAGSAATGVDDALEGAGEPPPSDPHADTSPMQVRTARE